MALSMKLKHGLVLRAEKAVMCLMEKTRVLDELRSGVSDSAVG